MSGKLSGHQAQNATPKPAISLSQPGLLQRTCECGGVPGLTGECEECSSKRLSGQRGSNPPALPNTPPDDPSTQVQRSALPSRRESPLPGFNFGKLAIAPKERLGMQTKLAIGQPGDRYEQEADRMAEQVMRMPEPKLQRVCSEYEEELQRQPMKEEKKKKEDEETLQTKTASGESPTVSPALQSQITALQGGGQPLPESERNFFEPRFGADFSQVRIHTDKHAAETARAVNARAFTVGRNVVFGARQYQPRASEGQRLLAHELTHVVQQIGPQLQNIGAPVNSDSKRNIQSPIPITNLVSAAIIQLSPLSEELEQVWNREGKGVFFERLRHVQVTDPDVLTFIETNLVGDDLWLAKNIFLYGTETNWPIHLRVEREMKGWGDSHGKGAVFDILRTANGGEASNTQLTASISRVFAAGSDDIWLAQNLQAYGIETNWPMNVFIPPGSATAKQVQFKGNHTLTAYGSDPKANSLWTPTSIDHAVAYTKNASPVLDAQFQVGHNFSRINIPNISVRVLEGSTVCGTGSATISGDTATVSGITVAGLTNSDKVRSSSHSLIWEVSLNRTIWQKIATTSPHLIYWLQAIPTTIPLYNYAVDKATGYAASIGGDVATAIRSGLHGELSYDPADLINSNPLTIFSDGKAICTDFGNLLTLLACSVGLNANDVMFWGGFQSLGKNIWVTEAGGYTNLVGVNPGNWSFNYHVISRINGILHDAALNRTGIDAQALHAGKVIRLVELNPAALPKAKKGTAYSEVIPRKDHTVQVTIRDYGSLITDSTFRSGGDIYALQVSTASPSPVNVPVTWSLSGSTLPPGLSLNPLTGLLSGTPTSDGVFTVSIQVTAPPSTTPLINTSPLNIEVDP